MILSPLTDGRSQLRLHHSVPTEDASGVRSARRSLVLLAAQSQALDSQAALLQADEEILARCEALIASGGPSCGNELFEGMEFCPVCMLRKGLAGGVESGESSVSEDTVKPPPASLTKH